MKFCSYSMFDAQKCAQLPSQVTFANHLLEQIAQQWWIEAAGEFVNQRSITRHRLRNDDMSAPDARPVGCSHAQVFPSPLRPQPQRQRSDLCAARIDVHAIEIMFNYEPGCSPAQVGEFEEILL